MNILFIHQNFPGQFKHLAPVLVQKGYDVRTMTLKNIKAPEWNGVQQIPYKPLRSSSETIHPWLIDFEAKVIRAEAAFRKALELKAAGYTPDVIIAHPGWGESLFLKEVWPNVKLGIYCEFYYQSKWADAEFDPEFTVTDPGNSCRLRLKNINNILHYDLADAAIAPTFWQASTYPEPFRSRITVIHDGIDTSKVVPNARVSMNLKTATGNIRLSKADEVITFVNRNLEPHRGYHIFMRALPELLKRRPKARVLIVGGSDVSYGAKPPEGKSWKDIFISEVRERIADKDWARVHFLGYIPYDHFIPLLQLSTLHVYYTYPFVLSWSLLEAMSAGCAIVASKTKPVEEVIKHDETGRLVDFFNVAGLVDEVCDLLDDPAARTRLGAQARAFVVAKYDLHAICLPRQLEWVKRLFET